MRDGGKEGERPPDLWKGLNWVWECGGRECLRCSRGRGAVGGVWEIKRSQRMRRMWGPRGVLEEHFSASWGGGGGRGETGGTVKRVGAGL